MHLVISVHHIVKNNVILMFLYDKKWSYPNVGDIAAFDEFSHHAHEEESKLACLKLAPEELVWKWFGYKANWLTAKQKHSDKYQESCCLQTKILQNLTIIPLFKRNTLLLLLLFIFTHYRLKYCLCL